METQFLSLPFLFASFIFIFTLFKLCKIPGSKSLKPPPGPRRLPIIGNIHQLATPLPHQRLRDLAGKYGPLMSIKIGEMSSVIVSTAEAAQEVLKTQDATFADRPASIASRIVLYNRNDIVFGSYGPQWRQTRKLCVLELLSAKRIQSFKSVREEEVDEFAKSVYAAGGTPVNLTDKLFALTNTIMARTTIGKKCKRERDLLRCIDNIFEESGVFNLADAFPSLTLLPVITGFKSRLVRLHRDTDEILEEILAEHRANKASSPEDSRNLLHVLLDLQEKGDLEVPITNDSIKATILDIFVAGSDTSAKTVEWALSELMKNPRLMKKAQEEVRQAFGEKGFVDESGLQDLKFMKLIVKETLRLHPVFALFPRQCRQNTKVNGYDIAPKTTMLVNVWAINRDPNVWPDAETFRPERFLDSSVDYKGNSAEMIPFGAGKRVCLGMTLGTLILELFLAKLLYHFDWKFPDGVNVKNFDMTEHYSASMRRKSDLVLIPVPVNPLPAH